MCSTLFLKRHGQSRKGIGCPAAMAGHTMCVHVHIEQSLAQARGAGRGTTRDARSSEPGAESRASIGPRPEERHALREASLWRVLSKRATNVLAFVAGLTQETPGSSSSCL